MMGWRMAEDKGKRFMNMIRDPRSAIREQVIRFLYATGFFIFAIFYLPAFIMKGKHRNGLSERLGYVPTKIKARLAGKKVFWIHAVSVGEVMQAVRFSKELRHEFPAAQILLTVTTTAGHDVAGRLKDENDTLLFFPVDFRGTARRFVDSVGPAALILMETELWPNLIDELVSRKVPIYVVNGRLSDRSIGQYRRFRSFLRPVFEKLSGVGAQDETMRARFVEMGVLPERVVVTGNLKFDWKPDPAREEEAQAICRKICKNGSFLLVAGSTHPGEEEMLFEAAAIIRTRHPEFQLLVAPRHLDRLSSIEHLAGQRGLSLARVSAVSGDGASGKAGDWLLDSMGILGAIYGGVDAVFVGGSLVPRGGHNLVEPAFYGKPLLFGPHMANFHEMAELFKQRQAAREVRDAQELARAVIWMMENPAARRKMGDAARAIVSQNEGAVRRNLETFFPKRELVCHSM